MEEEEEEEEEEPAPHHRREGAGGVCKGLGLCAHALSAVLTVFLGGWERGGEGRKVYVLYVGGDPRMVERRKM